MATSKKKSATSRAARPKTSTPPTPPTPPSRPRAASKAGGAGSATAATSVVRRVVTGAKKALATGGRTAAKAAKKASAATDKKSAANAKRPKTMAPPIETLQRLKAIHPDAHCELDHRNAFELIVATVLSAQTTDVNVNKATPKLFARFPDATALAAAEPEEVEPYVSTLGFFRQKSKSLVGLARALMTRHGGQVPRSMGELVKLPGVGRKTANVVLGVIWNTPDGVVVDTHVQRISQRLGWTTNTDPVRIEQDLCARLPREEWDMTSHVLIFHGRRICFARKPSCEGCGINDVCPSAFDAENVGRKPPRTAADPTAPATRRRAAR